MTKFCFRLIILSFCLINGASQAHACLAANFAHLSSKCETGIIDDFLRVVFPDAVEPRKVAVVAGVSRYPNLDDSLQLSAAQADISLMVDLYANQLGFDEVIVVANEDFNLRTIGYLFETYLPAQLTKHGNSQVVFTFSGHGADFDNEGYVFTHETASIEISSYTEVDNTIRLGLLKELLRPTLGTAHQFLALINSCNGGHFLTTGTQAFGSSFRERGAHGITAGGANETVYARSNVGTGKGSVFFEMVRAAFSGETVQINGARFPDAAGNDGILSVGELASFLNSTISVIEDNMVSPRADRIVQPTVGSHGEMFFIVDEARAAFSMSQRFPEEYVSVFGAEAPEVQNTNRVTSNQKCVAPQTVGRNYDEVLSILRAANYNHLRTASRNPAPAGSVFRQEPESLELFECSEQINLFVSEGPWLELPDVIGLEYSAAIQVLRENNLVPIHAGGSLQSDRQQRTICEATITFPVVTQVAPPDGRVFEGDKIELVTDIQTKFLFTGAPQGQHCP